MKYEIKNFANAHLKYVHSIQKSTKKDFSPNQNHLIQAFLLLPSLIMVCRKDCCRISAGAKERAKLLFRSSGFNLASSHLLFQMGNGSFFSLFFGWKLACAYSEDAFHSPVLNLFQLFAIYSILRRTRPYYKTDPMRAK